MCTLHMPVTLQMHKAFSASALKINDMENVAATTSLLSRGIYRELQVKGLLSSSDSAYSWHRHRVFIEAPPPPSHLFAPVKGKKRQALDESTFDLTEAPLLLLLSFTHHPPSPPGWGAVKSSEASLPDCARPRLRALSSTRPMLLEGG